jgi:hypothetical protein
VDCPASGRPFHRTWSTSSPLAYHTHHRHVMRLRVLGKAQSNVQSRRRIALRRRYDDLKVAAPLPSCAQNEAVSLGPLSQSTRRPAAYIAGQASGQKIGNRKLACSRPKYGTNIPALRKGGPKRPSGGLPTQESSEGDAEAGTSVDGRYRSLPYARIAAPMMTGRRPNYVHRAVHANLMPMTNSPPSPRIQTGPSGTLGKTGKYPSGGIKWAARKDAKEGKRES